MGPAGFPKAGRTQLSASRVATRRRLHIGAPTWTTGYGLRATGYGLRATGYGLPGHHCRHGALQNHTPQHELTGCYRDSGSGPKRWGLSVSDRASALAGSQLCQQPRGLALRTIHRGRDERGTAPACSAQFGRQGCWLHSRGVAEPAPAGAVL